MSINNTNNSNNNPLTSAMVASMATRHAWAATGVSDYPPRDPLVGQSRFFQRYRTFIHTVDQDADHFAHVFAVEAEWGRGKSRLGHELIAQINDCSKGWFVRAKDGQLAQQQLFDQAGQDKYLALYIRYSQVASEFQNSDNWFGFGLYKALLPLATKKFDGSIQSTIAEQALRRLEPMGFDAIVLAEKLALNKVYSDEALYEEDGLVVGLVQSAYAYLQQFGIQYLLVVLDELETVAEAATFGLEQDDAKRLDGQAIRLIGKAIKEEDPRRKLPWLRYVALCSPLLGQQLREIQSVARRFELVELEHNAFADVSDYVAQLKTERKLGFDYPTGLVEAAYAMSGANFGWFNVIMANVDAVLAQFQQAGKPIPAIGELFEAVVASSGRVAKHVLDAGAIESIKTGDHALKDSARALLYGQLPLPLTKCPPRSTELLAILNEDGEPVASLYRTVPYDGLKCRQALEEAKFQRKQDEWLYPSVEQSLNLTVLLQNLRTFAINETDSSVLLIPLARSEFKHLLALLYDHPAIEFAADALWQKLVGDELQLPNEEATHIGPSVPMLLRLDLRYRSQQNTSMIFRDPLYADAHDAAMKRFLVDVSKNLALRMQVRLTGLFRLLDKNWQYAQSPYPNSAGLSIQITPKGQGQGQHGGLVSCDALKLHPDNLAWFAWVNKRDDFDRLHQLLSLRRAEDGRMPVVAFTASTALMDQYTRGDIEDRLRDDLLLYYLNASEVDQIERIGLVPEYCKGFELNDAVFTAKFKSKINTLRDFAYMAMHKWRERLNSRGLIAWPMRPTGKLSPADRDLLFKAWKLLAVDEPSLQGLNDIEPKHGISADDVAGLLGRIGLSNRMLAQGFSANEHAGFFTDLADPQQAQARVPVFLSVIANPAVTNHQWTMAKAKQEWYWGYVSQGSGLTPKSVFDDWMWWCGELHLLQLEDSMATQAKWVTMPRSAFDNAITEAKNWFESNAEDGYKATVAKLERVFGSDKVPGLFAPLGKVPQGTQTVIANENLRIARQRFDKLKVEEEALVGEKNLNVVAEKLATFLQARSDILHCVAKVKPLQSPEISPGNINTLVLEDQSQALFQRIEQARLFAEFVDKAAKQIRNRIGVLLEEIDVDCHALKHFPKNLFTLSLQTVVSILEGALAQKKDGATSIGEATASSDTLSFYLRSLQLDQAAERLRLLGEEAGVDIGTGSQCAFAETPGHIMSAYRVCKEHYKKMTSYMDELQIRCDKALHLLEPLPADYAESQHPQELMAMKQKLLSFSDALGDLTENSVAEREKFSAQARKGQFFAIREVPDRLLNPIHSQLHVVAGALALMDNAMLAFKNKKLTAFNESLPPILGPLFLACKESVPQVMQINQLSGSSLHQTQMLFDVQTHQLEQKATQLLEGTGLSLDAWCALATAINAGDAPSIDPVIQNNLVAKGILKVQLTFGGSV